MSDELLELYDRELAFLRRTGAEFAKQYPKVAGRLLLEPTKCDDPHVERMLEGFAFLAARVHKRIEDDFPEFSEGILELAYPHYIRPTPSMSLVQFQLDPEQGKLTTGYAIPRGTKLYTKSVDGVKCQFQTCYDTTLWPVDVTAAKWVSPQELSPPVRAPDAIAALRVELTCAPDVTFEKLELDRLRFFIRADAALANTLYEMLCNNCVRILARQPGGKREPATLPASAIRPVGFEADEGMLPQPRRAFVGYRLLQEYFTFPTKFLFFEITGFDAVRAACPGDRAELVFLIAPFERADRRASLESGVTKDTLRTGCSPVINLFPRTAEPIQLNQRRLEYLVIPDARRRAWTGVFSVEGVGISTAGSKEEIPVAPFHSFRHVTESGRPTMFWAAKRRAAGWRDDKGTDVWMAFVDLSSRSVYPDADTATVRTLCHNADLPSRLPFTEGAFEFEMEGGGPIKRTLALTKPTAPLHPPLGKPQLWRLISQLSLNYMSLIEGGADGLRELLALHDFSNSPAAEREIRGIVSVAGAPVFARIDGEHGMTFARGHRVDILFDEEDYAGGGVYLMASVLERFLGLYVSLNSFSTLLARTRQRKEPLRQWAPRSGWKALI